MIRKLALLCFSVVAMNAHAGFYGGVGIGPETADFDQNAFVSKPGTINVIDTNHYAGKGAFASIFAGYSWLIQQIFIAAEINANYSNDTFKATNNEFLHQAFNRNEYRMRSSYGISALPGYLMPNLHTLFYGRLGFNSGHFQVYTTDPSLKNFNRHLNGFRYGIGILEHLTSKIGVRLEYSQVLYQNTSIFTLDTHTNTAKKTRYQPTTSLVEFGVLYDFA